MSLYSLQFKALMIALMVLCGAVAEKGEENTHYFNA